jgi:hypothetical protein
MADPHSNFETFLDDIRQMKGDMASGSEVSDDLAARGRSQIWGDWSAGEAEVLLQSACVSGDADDADNRLSQIAIFGHSGLAWLEFRISGQRLTLPERRFFDWERHTYYVRVYSQDEIAEWYHALLRAVGWETVFRQGYSGGQLALTEEGEFRLGDWITEWPPEDIRDKEHREHKYVLGCECGIWHENPADCDSEGATLVCQHTDAVWRQYEIEGRSISGEFHAAGSPFQLEGTVKASYSYKVYVRQWRAEEGVWAWARSRDWSGELPSEEEIDREYISTENALLIVDNFVWSERVAPLSTFLACFGVWSGPLLGPTGICS